MGIFRRLPAAFVKLLLLAGLAAIWYAFAPTQLGGQVSYVIINGISMEPNYHAGDLVIARRAAAYEVGDVTPYHDAQMNANVIHRIIGTQQGRFIMKGDNNSWIDSYKPTQDEILGKLWLYLPKMGTAVLWVRTPIYLALIVGGLGGVLMLKSKEQKHRMGRKSPQPSVGKPSVGFEMTLYTTVVLSLVFLLLSIYAFTRPLLKNGDALKYEQTGVFSYTTTGTPVVYDSDSVEPPEPIFTKLNCTLGLSFSYILQGDNLEDFSGTQSLTAVIMDPQSGWKHTIPLTTETGFSGNSAENQAAIDLCQVQALVTEVEQKTGARLNAYTLNITANLSVTGKLSGQAFSDTFEPTFAFNFDSLRFYLAQDLTNTNSLVTVQPGALNNPGKVENTIKLIGFQPTVKSIRVIALIGLILSLSGLLGVGYTIFDAIQNSPETLIHLKYGPILMDVKSPGLGSLSPIIDVAAIEDLAKLAERQNGMILHLTGEPENTYCVQLDGTTYRYVVKKKRPITSD